MISPFVHLLKIVTIAAAAILVALGGRTFFDYYQDKEADPLIGRPFNLRISEDDDGDSLAKTLSDGDMIRSELYFTTALRLTGDDLAPGTYTLRHGMSVNDILEEVTVEGEDDGEEGGEGREAVETVELVFPEGFRIGQMADVVEEADLPWGGDEFLEAVDAIPRDQFEFLDSVPDDLSLEGYLFPASYQVNTDWSPEDLVFQMLMKFDDEFTPQLEERADDMGMSIHEVITLASIVEREAAVDDERARIAQVYLNRINSDETNGLLQADPTVVYILGDEDDWWPDLESNQATEDERVIDSPYNTYVTPGLPPGPIANPGSKSIVAALAPDGSDYLYFVAMNDDSGRHVFATTYPEQLQNECDQLGGSACDF